MIMNKDRYIVTAEGSAQRPFAVFDSAGGWVCSRHTTRAAAAIFYFDIGAVSRSESQHGSHTTK